MQPDKIFQSLEFNLMILRRTDGIAAIRTTPPVCPILSLYWEQILVLLLVIGDGEFCWWTAAAFMIVFGNLSKNRSVGEDLYKCKGIRLLQVHGYWGKGEGRWMYLEGDCSKLYSYSKKKKTPPMCNKNWEGGKNTYEFQIWNGI